jgi:hypothetical protein
MDGRLPRLQLLLSGKTQLYYKIAQFLKGISLSCSGKRAERALPMTGGPTENFDWEIYENLGGHIPSI